MDSSCVKHVLAEGYGFMVESCSCGSIHLHTGATTIRLEENAAFALNEILSEAMYRHEKTKELEHIPRPKPLPLRLVSGGITKSGADL